MGLFEKIPRRRAFGDASIGHQRDEVGCVAGESHLMGHQDDGFPGILQLGNDIQNLGGHLGIQSGGGFVEQEKRGIDSESAGDGDALPLAAAELRGLLAGVVEQLETREELVRAGFGLLRGESMNLLERETDILQGGEVWEKIVGLEYDTQSAAMGAESGFIGRNEVPIDPDFSRIGLVEAGEQAEKGGFSAAGGADEGERVIEFDLEVEIPKNTLSTEGFGDPAEADFHRLRSFSGNSSGTAAKSGRGTSTISSTITGSKGTPGASGGAGFSSTQGM